MSTAGWIILIVVAAVMIIPSIFLINGKGAWLIAGYNTMSPERKSQYDEKALCKFTGWLLLIYTIGLFLGMILLHWEYRYRKTNYEKVETFKDRSFDVVFCHNVLEYIKNKESVSNIDEYRNAAFLII